MDEHDDCKPLERARVNSKLGYNTSLSNLAVYEQLPCIGWDCTYGTWLACSYVVLISCCEGCLRALKGIERAVIEV